MKKIILSVAVLIVTAFYANAQSYTLSWHDEILGDTVVVDSINSYEMIFEVVFTNNTSHDANIIVAREEIFVLEGDTTMFCWGACWPWNMDTSNFAVNIPAGVSNGEFSAHYQYHDAVGVALVAYKFYNEDNPDEFVRIVAKHNVNVDAIDENILNNLYVSDIYPNPATNFVNIDYELPGEVSTASVKIVNLLGSIVMNQQVDTRNNYLRMNISELNGGIYFYSFFVNGEIYSTKKFVVR